ncbi:hypothetical protein ZWY2020_054547 [Hordeum vulgare]|nr:hypothetical protein ZWY2020_054547 [Hordeum vulgare]
MRTNGSNGQECPQTRRKGTNSFSALSLNDNENGGAPLTPKAGGRQRGCRLQQPYAGLATAASRQDALDATREESGQPDKGNKNRWMELPPFAPVDAAAAAKPFFVGREERR